MAEKSKKTKPVECSGKLTLPLTEGPLFKPGSPEKKNIAAQGTAGTKLVVEGYVFDRNCQPIARARLDFWHTNSRGEYDTAGYNLRGYQYTDENGCYRLETIRPSAYGPRTAHIHVKVQANDSSPVLTTQLFFPGLPKNEADEIFDSSLLMDVVKTKDGEKATFNFVLDVG